MIVGANATGATAAATLREEGFDGRIVLIGDDPLAPYERPPLSKEFLRGEQDDQTWFRPAEYWSEQSIDTRFGVRVTGVDTSARTVSLDGGQTESYDALLLATGVRNRDLDVPGADLDGVLDLRRPGDSQRIRDAAAAAPGGRVVMAGFGFIGAEVAASLRELGLDVTIVEFASTAMERALGTRFGRIMEAIHRDHGVEMNFHDTVERFEGSGRVEAVATGKGTRIECDFAVVGIGTVPNTELAEDAQIPVDKGIKVGPSLRTDVAGVYAAGDIALHEHPVFGAIRVEHFDNAQSMGAHVARAMLGSDEPFTDPHWFWSDQYDVNVQMAGFTLEWPDDEVVIRGSEADRKFVAFRLQDGAIRACFGINLGRDVRRSRALIEAQVPVEREALADPDVDLRTLAPPRS